MTNPHSTPDSGAGPTGPGSGDTGAGDETSGLARRSAPRWVLTVGLVIFAIGAVFTVLAAAIPYFSDGRSQGWLFVVAMTFLPIGFLVCIGYGIFGALPPRPATGSAK